MKRIYIFKKGFTLIELLSVIVILAIVLIIAVPKVLNVVEKVKKSAFEDDIKNVVKTYDLKLVTEQNPSAFSVSHLDIEDKLKLDNDNYKYLEITNNDEGIYVIAEGQNTYEDYVICGNKNNLSFYEDIEDCNRIASVPVYTNEQITEKVALGYIPIATADELNNIRNNTPNTFGLNTDWENTYTGGLDKNYIQVSNIDLDVEPYNTGNGWVPIGYHDYDCEFTNSIDQTFGGIFDGGGYKISNLYINSYNSLTPVGMFSVSTGDFYNVNLENAEVIFAGQRITGTSYCIMPTGILVGAVTGNDIVFDNINILGSLNSKRGADYWTLCWPDKAGLLVAHVYDVNSLTITNSKVFGTLMNDGTNVGGLVGRVVKYNDILVENSSFKGRIIGSPDRGPTRKTGSIIGGAMADTSSADEPVPYANSITLRNVHAVTDLVTDITASNKNGGLIGDARWINSVLIEDSSYIGNITDGFNNTGGLVGRVRASNSVVIKNSTAKGNIRGSDGWTTDIGGIIGNLKGVSYLLLDNVHHEGDFSMLTINRAINSKIGGLVGNIGYAYDTPVDFPITVDIINCSAKGNFFNVTTRTGGLIGCSEVSNRDLVNSIINIENSFYEGNITTNSNLETWIDTYNGLTYSNSRYLLLGGLVGAGNVVNITNSYAKTNIDGYYDNPLCRNRSVTITTDHHAVGGLVGAIKTSVNINNSYYAGNIVVRDAGVIQDLNTFDYINAVVGDKDNATLTNVYYDSTLTTVQDTLAIPKTTAELYVGLPSTEIYTNWDTNIWDFNDNDKYPSIKN